MRIKLQFPEKVIFSTQIPVSITDLNYGQHVGNQHILAYAHEARVRWLKQIGYNELGVGEVGMIMADAAIQFKAEGFYGDILTIQLGISNMLPHALDLYYQINAIREGQDKPILMAMVKTAMIAYNYHKKEIGCWPEDFIQALDNYNN